MKITELLEQRQDLDELNMAQVGNAVGKGATAVGKGIGAAAGGAVQAGKNFWSGLKQGWNAGKGSVADQQPSANQQPSAGPAAGQAATAAPAAGGAAQPAGQPAVNAQPAPTQAGPTAGQGATAAPAAAGKGGNGGGAATAQPAPAANTGAVASLKAQIDKLDPASRQSLVKALQAAPAAQQPAAATAQPAAPAQGATAQPAAPAQAAPAAAPAAQQKMTAKDQNALKARLKAKQGTAAKTQSGFNQYVQGGGGQTLAGADAQGNPVFKQNVQRESVEFYSKFLGKAI